MRLEFRSLFRPSRRRGGPAREGLALAVAAGLGAGLMFLLDPLRGRYRRAVVRGKAVRSAKRAATALDAAGRDAAHRGRGLAARLRARFEAREAPPDELLRERVRAELGHVVSHPAAIRVNAREGAVTLEGDVLRAEHDPALRRARLVPGAAEVVDHLEVHDTAGMVPGLQGAARRSRGGWTPAGSLGAAVAGAALAIVGLRRRPQGYALAAVGAQLLARAAYQLAGRRGARDGRIWLHKTITIGAPVSEAFALFSDLERLPRFMDHIEEVELEDEDRSRWRVTGPAGIPVEWRQRITRREPDRLLAFESEPGARVALEGVARFEPADGGTRLDLRLAYRPPGGRLGHAVARLFHADPRSALDDDLLRFKSLLETGRATAHHRKVTREELAAERRGEAPPPS